MIRVAPHALSNDTSTRLAALQQQVDSAGAYAQQVKAAKELYAQHCRGDRSPFREVREALRALCPGDQHCMYCEDAPADEVEHIRPKDLFPEVVFAWANFLFACGTCNGRKLARFRVFHPRGSTTEVELTRAPNTPVVPPLDGDALLIDPRSENPLDYLWLDLKTARFAAAAALSTRDAARAKYTLTLLGLNTRDRLVRTRASAIHHYGDHLRCYVEDRRRDPQHPDLAARAARVRAMSHATVWHELKRQHATHTPLASHFAEAPEALGW